MLLSAEVAGPQVSSEGRLATRSAREVVGIFIMIYGQYALGNCSKIKKVEGWSIDNPGECGVD
jgi:hypothetical protein